jgi:hypothetical protein
MGRSRPIDSFQIRAERDDFKNMKIYSTPTNETATASLVWIPAPITLIHFSILGKLSQNATDSKFLLAWPNKERNLEKPTLVLLIRIPIQHWNRENEFDKVWPKIVCMHPLHFKFPPLLSDTLSDA